MGGFNFNMEAEGTGIGASIEKGRYAAIYRLGAEDVSPKGVRTPIISTLSFLVAVRLQ